MIYIHPFRARFFNDYPSDAKIIAAKDQFNFGLPGNLFINRYLNLQMFLAGELKPAEVGLWEP